ncbi:unnamed protein product, partial [marine sediment metagenome]
SSTQMALWVRVYSDDTKNTIVSGYQLDRHYDVGFNDFGTLSGSEGIFMTAGQVMVVMVYEVIGLNKTFSNAYAEINNTAP